MEHLVGLLLPFIIDILNQKVANSKIRFFVSLLVCIATAAVLKFESLKLDNLAQVLESAGLIFGEAQIVYKLYWEKSGARQAAFGPDILKK